MTKHMNKKTIFYFVLAAVILVLIAIYAAYSLRPVKLPTAIVINNTTHKFTAYAYTQTQQEHGLMNSTVTNSTLMLFSFGTYGVYPFWMKDTYSPLDIMWVSYNRSANIGYVVYIVNASPCSSYDSSQANCIIYTPSSKANYVIEAKAGFTKRNNISIGTEIQMLYK